MVPKREKGAAGAGLESALARRLAVSVATSSEEMSGMAPLWKKKLYCFGCALLPCLRNVNAVSSVVEWGRADVTSFLSMEVPCKSLLWNIVDEDFCPCCGHGGLVVVEFPV